LDTLSHSRDWEGVSKLLIGAVYISCKTNWSQSAGYIE